MKSIVIFVFLCLSCTPFASASVDKVRWDFLDDGSIFAISELDFESICVSVTLNGGAITIDFPKYMFTEEGDLESFEGRLIHKVSNLFLKNSFRISRWKLHPFAAMDTKLEQRKEALMASPKGQAYLDLGYTEIQIVQERVACGVSKFYVTFAKP